MTIVVSKLGSAIGAFLSGRSYWAVLLDNGEWLCELDEHIDLVRGHRRNLEWYDDICANSDNMRIKELRLYAPRNRASQIGNIARLPIKEPGTAFQFKGRQMQMESEIRTPTYQVIGRVENKETGDCVAFIYDYLMKCMSKPYYTNIRDFKPWRPGACPVGELSLDVIGVRL